MLTEDVVAFLVEAKMACYAGNGPKITPFRPNTYDLKFEKDDLLYYDTYVGTDVFAGEEGIWHCGKPIWMMNYIGRLLEPGYNYDFLIEALQHSTVDMPFRGPKEYSSGDYCYRCTVNGDMNWFTGNEEIGYKGKRFYECLFHGGTIR